MPMIEHRIGKVTVLPVEIDGQERQLAAYVATYREGRGPWSAPSLQLRWLRDDGEPGFRAPLRHEVLDVLLASGILELALQVMQAQGAPAKAAKAPAKAAKAPAKAGAKAGAKAAKATARDEAVAALSAQVAQIAAALRALQGDEGGE